MPGKILSGHNKATREGKLAKGKSTIQSKQSVEEVFGYILRTDLKYINKWAPAAFSGKEVSREFTYFANLVLDDHHCKVLGTGKDIRRMDDEGLHRLRIECKKLRYATEFFMPLYGTKMATFSKKLKQLQDVLGILHDCYVMGGLQKFCY